MKFVFTKSVIFAALLVTVLGMGVAFNPGQAQPPHYTLTVVVTHTLPAIGQVKVSLFNSKSTFLKSPLIKKQTQAAPGGKTILSFDNLPAGDYAVSVVHDQDADGKLDRNFIGKPREPFGFSNNVHVKFAPPPFDKAKFTVDDQDQTIVIDLDS